MSRKRIDRNQSRFVSWSPTDDRYSLSLPGGGLRVREDIEINRERTKPIESTRYLVTAGRKAGVEVPRRFKANRIICCDAVDCEGKQKFVQASSTQGIRSGTFCSRD
jgi:hypothetical protein